MLKSESAALCSTGITPGPWLFSDDLARRLREAKETSKISEAFHSHGYRSEKQSREYERSLDVNSPKGGKNNFLYRASKTNTVPEKTETALSRHEILEKLENIRHSVSDLKTFEPELLNYFRSQCDNFKPGRVAQFFPNCGEITTDKEILSCISGTKIEFETAPRSMCFTTQTLVKKNLTL